MPHAAMSTEAYVDTTIGIVLYHERVRRGMSPKRWLICGDANATAHASSHAWATDTAAKTVTCSATCAARSGTSGKRVARCRTNGRTRASRIHRGVVDSRTVGQPRGNPCVTETCRA